MTLEPFNLLEEAPLWLLWPLLAAACLVAQEIGFRGRRHFAPSAQGDDEGSVSGRLLSTALALLGLLIAFTFSMAAQRYDVRRIMVVQEANAVGTTYLRVQLLPEPARTQVSRQLLAYIDGRLDFFHAGRDDQAQDRIAARADAVQTHLWSALGAAITAQPQATINPSLLQTTNEMFDLATTDRAALDARVPLAVLRTLVAYALISALIMGYLLAAGKDRQFVASATLFILVALAISLILDIDRPSSGTITISDVPFVRAAASIRAMEVAHQTREAAQ